MVAKTVKSVFLAPMALNGRSIAEKVIFSQKQIDFPKIKYKNILI